MRSDKEGATLAGRLATTLTVVAIASAAIATGTAMVLADALITARVENSVAASARVLQVEIDEAPGSEEALAEEARSLGIDGRVAIVEAGQVVFGDEDLSADHVEGCAVIEGRDTSTFTCSAPLARSPSSVVLVAVPADRLHGHRRALFLAALAVLLLVAAAVRAMGGALSRRALEPLHRLHDAVAGTDAASPASIDLPPATGLEEIDALRNVLGSFLQRLEEELGRARRFAASAAHELRTPLATMRGELELANESTQDEAEQRRTTRRLIKTTARLEALTQQLLLLATPHDALALHECTSMAQLVEDLVDRRFRDSESRLRLDVCESDALTPGDVHLLAAVLDNLVDNALKFSDGQVDVAVSTTDGWVVVDVHDEGPGVPEELESQLFEPFRRGPNRGTLPGNGLGLALALHIARSYGGHISFVRQGDAGSTVRLRLPQLIFLQ